MDEKDTLKEMFMDMSKANQWAQEVMTPDGKGLDYWTTMIDDLTIRNEKDTDELGWSNKEIKYKTIWEFTGQNPGKDLGKIVFNASLEQGVKSIKKVDYRAYPEAWLDMWFRDYDAKLSMEVYNKAKAKEALNQINNKNK